MPMSDQVLTILNQIQKDLADIKKKVNDLEPVYGSDAWWEWSDKQAVEDIKAGHYTTIRSKKELSKFLNSLKKQKLKIQFTKQAETAYRKLLLNIQKKLDKQLAFLISDYRHPSLRTRKMEGAGHFEGRIDRKYRFTYLVQGDEIYILSAGIHDEGLGKNQ